MLCMCVHTWKQDGDPIAANHWNWKNSLYSQLTSVGGELQQFIFVFKITQTANFIQLWWS